MIYQASHSSPGNFMEQKKPIAPDFDTVERAVWEVRLNLVITESYYIYPVKGGSPTREKQTRTRTEKLSHGTGFFVNPRQIITNFHVISGFLNKDSIESLKNSRPEIESVSLSLSLHSDHEDNQEINGMKAHISAVSAIYDLAFLESESPVEHYLSISREKETRYKYLFNIGYPGHFIIKRQLIGQAEGVDKYSFKVDNDQYQGDDFSGASGSPVFNEKNEVVGVLYSGTKTETRVINLNSLNKFLTGNHLKCNSYETEQFCLFNELKFMCEGMSGRKEGDHPLFIYSSYCNFGEPKFEYRPSDKEGAFFKGFASSVNGS